MQGDHVERDTHTVRLHDQARLVHIPSDEAFVYIM